LGSEHSYGPHSKLQDAREIFLRVTAKHTDKRALIILSQEMAPSALAMAPGITGSVCKLHCLLPYTFVHLYI
jgi:hypothetical protein